MTPAVSPAAGLSLAALLDITTPDGGKESTFKNVFDALRLLDDVQSDDAASTSGSSPFAGQLLAGQLIAGQLPGGQLPGGQALGGQAVRSSGNPATEKKTSKDTSAGTEDRAVLSTVTVPQIPLRVPANLSLPLDPTAAPDQSPLQAGKSDVEGPQIEADEVGAGNKPQINADEGGPENGPRINADERGSDKTPEINAGQLGSGSKPQIKTGKGGPENGRQINAGERRSDKTPQINAEQLGSGNKPRINTDERGSDKTPLINADQLGSGNKPQINAEERRVETAPQIGADQLRSDNTPQINANQLRSDNTPPINADELRSDRTPRINAGERKSEKRPQTNTDELGSGKVPLPVGAPQAAAPQIEVETADPQPAGTPDAQPIATAAVAAPSVPLVPQAENLAFAVRMTAPESASAHLPVPDETAHAAPVESKPSVAPNGPIIQAAPLQKHEAATPQPVMQFGETAPAAAPTAPLGERAQTAPQSLPLTPAQAHMAAELPKPSSSSEILLHLAGNDASTSDVGRAAIRVTDRAGAVSVTVHASDPVLRESLRTNLSDLSSQLANQGWKADVVKTASQQDSHQAGQRNFQQQQNSGGDRQGQRERRGNGGQWQQEFDQQISGGDASSGGKR